MLKASSQTYWTVQHRRDVDVRVVDITSINAVVMMAPDPMYCLRYHDGTEKDRWFLMEKFGAKISAMVGYEEVAGEE